MTWIKQSDIWSQLDTLHRQILSILKDMCWDFFTKSMQWEDDEMKLISRPFWSDPLSKLMRYSMIVDYMIYTQPYTNSKSKVSRLHWGIARSEQRRRTRFSLLIDHSLSQSHFPIGNHCCQLALVKSFDHSQSRACCSWRSSDRYGWHYWQTLSTRTFEDLPLQDRRWYTETS